MTNPMLVIYAAEADQPHTQLPLALYDDLNPHYQIYFADHGGQRYFVQFDKEAK